MKFFGVNKNFDFKNGRTNNKMNFRVIKKNNAADLEIGFS